MFSFVVFLSARLHYELPSPVVSPRFCTGKRFSSGLLFLAAADSFPTLVFCCGEWEWGEDGKGFSLGVCMCTSVHVSTCRKARPLQLLRTDEKPTHTAGTGFLERMEIWRWQSSRLSHITNPSDRSNALGGRSWQLKNMLDVLFWLKGQFTPKSKIYSVKPEIIHTPGKFWLKVTLIQPASFFLIGNEISPKR